MDTLINVFNENSLIDTIPLKNISNNNELFTIKEYGNYFIELKTRGLVSLEIETFDSEIPFIIKNNEKICVNTHNKENSLVPGRYCVNIIKDNVKKKYFYKVDVVNLDFEKLYKIKETLEAIYPNITKKILENSRQSGIIKNSNENEFIKYIGYSKYHEELMYNVNLIIQNPITNLKKEYIKSYFLKKVDHKILKSIEISDGIGENIYLQKKIICNSDIPENRWLFQNLNEIIEHLKIIKIKLQIQLNNTEKKIKDDIELFEKLKLKNISLISDRFIVGASTQDILRNKLSFLDREIKKKKEASLNLKKFLKDKNFEILSLNNLLHNNFFEELTNKHIPIKNKNKIVKDKRYFWIDEFMEFFKKRDNLKAGKFNAYINKPTWLLFEYYCFFMILNIFNDLGFNLINEMNENFAIFDLELIDSIKFENKNLRIELFYDKEIEENNGIGFNASLYKNRRPDIFITISLNGVIKAAVVVEVKCCRAYTLYNSNFPTKRYEQIRNYTGIHYKPKNKKIIRDIVKKIIVPYPSQSYRVTQKNDAYADLIDFIPLEIQSKNFDETEGYYEIKESLKEILNEVEEI